MKTLGAYEAKTHLSRLLDEVERGEGFVITRHGRPVAVLRGYPSERLDLGGRIRDFRRRHRIAEQGIGMEEILSLRDEGRR